jgi:hypothetical protein
MAYGAREAIPVSLSLHPTVSCARNCAHCYLVSGNDSPSDERDTNFFVHLIECAAQCGLREAAMAVNVPRGQGDRNEELLRSLSAAAATGGLRFVVTANPETVVRLGAAAFARCSNVALSYNEILFRDCPAGLYRALDQLRGTGTSSTINVMLSRRILGELTSGLLDRFLEVADGGVYLFLPKNAPLDFSAAQLQEFLNSIANFFRCRETFDRLHLDVCVRASIYPFSEVYPYSNCGRELLCVDAAGGVAYCPFERPFRYLRSPSELREIIAAGYAEGIPRRRCPHVHFEGN